MNEKRNNWKEELKQKLRYWFWHQRTKLHRFIDRLHIWCRDKLVDYLESIQNWSHRKLDEIYDKIYDDDEPQIDDMVEEEGG